jgi:hypothetical protein
MTYEYLNINNIPNLDKIHEDIELSLMSNKSVIYCLWKQKCLMLYILFESELSLEDKLILDDIVNLNS